MSRWDELIAEFRALGGTASNVRLGEGRIGLGLFAVNPRLPVCIRVPENLLVDTRDVVLENGVLKLAPEARIGARERRFFESYQADFGWGRNGRADIERIVEQAHALPDELRETLTNVYRCGTWFGTFGEDMVLQRFIASRRFDHRDRAVLMPVLDLMNHGTGLTFESGEGVQVRGVVQDELLVRYGLLDAFSFFVNWGFASPEPLAFSLVLDGNIGEQPLRIEREFKSGSVPELTFRDGMAHIKSLIVGNRNLPAAPRGVFYKLARDAGLGGYQEAFDMIQYVNQMNFLNLLEAIEDVEGPLIDTMRQMARFQLQALSFSFGAQGV